MACPRALTALASVKSIDDDDDGDDDEADAVEERRYLASVSSCSASL